VADAEESSELPDEAERTPEAGGDSPNGGDHPQSRIEPTAAAVAKLVAEGIDDTFAIAQILSCAPVEVEMVRMSNAYSETLDAMATASAAEAKLKASLMARAILDSAKDKLAEGKAVSTAEVNFISKLFTETRKAQTTTSTAQPALSAEAQDFLNSIKGET